MSVDYRVRLEAFEGPLDLLLHLVRRAEVEITDIPIAQIAEQYTAFLREGGIERIDIDTAGEFLVMAATLMEIKARLIAGQNRDAGADAAALGVEGSRDAEDPRAELVRQLLAYKRFRDAAESLEQRKLDRDARFPAARAGVDQQALREEMLKRAADLDLEDLTIVDLAQAFATIAASVNFDRLGEHQVTYDDTPIELHAEDILDRLRRAADAHHAGEPGVNSATLTLQALCAGRRRQEMIGLFLATLELVRRRAIRLRQDAPGGPIALEILPPEPVARPQTDTPAGGIPASAP